DDFNWPGPTGKIVIGSVPVKEWKDNTPIPDLGWARGARAEAGMEWHATDATDFIESTLYRLSQLKDWERFDRLTATIPGEPAEGGLALYRDMLLVDKLESVRRPKEAMALRARIFPVLKPRVSDRVLEEKGSLMAAYVADLLREGKRDEARKAANESVAAL